MGECLSNRRIVECPPNRQMTIVEWSTHWLPVKWLNTRRILECCRRIVDCLSNRQVVECPSLNRCMPVECLSNGWMPIESSNACRRFVEYLSNGWKSVESSIHWMPVESLNCWMPIECPLSNHWMPVEWLKAHQNVECPSANHRILECLSNHRMVECPSNAHRRIIDWLNACRIVPCGWMGWMGLHKFNLP